MRWAALCMPWSCLCCAVPLLLPARRPAVRCASCLALCFGHLGWLVRPMHTPSSACWDCLRHNSSNSCWPPTRRHDCGRQRHHPHVPGGHCKLGACNNCLLADCCNVLRRQRHHPHVPGGQCGCLQQLSCWADCCNVWRRQRHHPHVPGGHARRVCLQFASLQYLLLGRRLQLQPSNSLPRSCKLLHKHKLLVLIG